MVLATNAGRQFKIDHSSLFALALGFSENSAEVISTDCPSISARSPDVKKPPCRGGWLSAILPHLGWGPLRMTNAPELIWFQRRGAMAGSVSLVR
jgi:hypothetical protein